MIARLNVFILCFVAVTLNGCGNDSPQDKEPAPHYPDVKIVNGYGLAQSGAMSQLMYSQLSANEVSALQSEPVGHCHVIEQDSSSILLQGTGLCSFGANNELQSEVSSYSPLAQVAPFSILFSDAENPFIEPMFKNQVGTSIITIDFKEMLGDQYPSGYEFKGEYVHEIGNGQVSTSSSGLFYEPFNTGHHRILYTLVKDDNNIKWGSLDINIANEQPDAVVSDIKVESSQNNAELGLDIKFSDYIDSMDVNVIDYRYLGDDVLINLQPNGLFFKSKSSGTYSINLLGQDVNTLQIKPFSLTIQVAKIFEEANNFILSENGSIIDKVALQQVSGYSRGGFYNAMAYIDNANRLVSASYNDEQVVPSDIYYWSNNFILEKVEFLGDGLKGHVGLFLTGSNILVCQVFDTSNNSQCFNHIEGGSLSNSGFTNGITQVVGSNHLASYGLVQNGVVVPLAVSYSDSDSDSYYQLEQSFNNVSNEMFDIVDLQVSEFDDCVLFGARRLDNKVLLWGTPSCGITSDNNEIESVTELFSNDVGMLGLIDGSYFPLAGEFVGEDMASVKSIAYDVNTLLAINDDHQAVIYSKFKQEWEGLSKVGDAYQLESDVFDVLSSDSAVLIQTTDNKWACLVGAQFTTDCNTTLDITNIKSVALLNKYIVTLNDSNQLLLFDEAGLRVKSYENVQSFYINGEQLFLFMSSGSITVYDVRFDVETYFDRNLSHLAENDFLDINFAYDAKGGQQLVVVGRAIPTCKTDDMEGCVLYHDDIVVGTDLLLIQSLRPSARLEEDNDGFVMIKNNADAIDYCHLLGQSGDVSNELKAGWGSNSETFLNDNADVLTSIFKLSENVKYLEHSTSSSTNKYFTIDSFSPISRTVGTNDSYESVRLACYR